MEAVPASKKDDEVELCLFQLVLFKRDSWGKEGARLRDLRA